MDCSVSCVVWL